MAESLKSRIKSQLMRQIKIQLSKRDYQLSGGKLMPPDYDQATIDLYWKVKPYTLTSHERVFALRQAVTYVANAGIPGAIVECGVWRGGSMLVIAHTLLELGHTDRDLYLFDTFETMPPPGELDVDVWGIPAADNYQAALDSPVYAYIPQDHIRSLLVATGYPEERLHFVKGMVEDTIPAGAPDAIALCRLDTDWYESTAHEMEHLYPRLTPGGILIIDDYGHYMGARKAVDEYIANKKLNILLNRIDMTGRLVVIPSPSS
jgi:O-methyltransferase